MKLHQLKTEFGSQIAEIAKRRNIENIRVFGSVARGDSGEKSDVDFLVHLRPQASLLDLSGFNLDLQDLGLPSKTGEPSLTATELWSSCYHSYSYCCCYYCYLSDHRPPLS